jgi:hypothetical protein
MGKNTGNGTRIGIIGGRTQVYNDKTDCYIKRDTETGRFIGVKKATPFKDIKRENLEKEKERESRKK